MKRLQSVFEGYLQKIGRLAPEDLGNEPQSVTENDKKNIVEQLSKEFAFNQKIIVVYIVMLFLLFGVGIFIVLYYLNSPKAIGAVWGGTFLSLLGIVERLRRLWREKSIMDVTLSVIQDLPPEETVKMIELFYWSFIRQKRR
jgi:hypothetical protein